MGILILAKKVMSITTFYAEKSLEILIRGFAAYASCDEVSFNNDDNSIRTSGSNTSLIFVTITLTSITINLLTFIVGSISVCQIFEGH